MSCVCTENPASWAGEKNILDGEEKVSEANLFFSKETVKTIKQRKLTFYVFLAHPVYFANLLLVCQFSLHKYVDHTFLKILSGQPFL